MACAARFRSRLGRIFAFTLVCLSGALAVSGAAVASERLINIKVAQYATTLEFTAGPGAVWDLGGKNGRIAGADLARVAGVLEKKAVKRYHVMTASARADETSKLALLEAEWRNQGFQARIFTVGRPLLADDGKTVLHDGRLGMVDVGVFNTESEAQALVDKLAAQGKSSWIYTEVVSRSQGRLTLLVNGQAVAEGQELYIVPEQTLLLKKVEYAAGYPWHGFADRTYRGKLILRWGAENAIDGVLNTPLETVLAGVVPSEISGNAQIGALQAQACAARGEIMSKIGIRHINEGFDTCSEQHCQVFGGESALALAVAQKIAPTHGCVLTESSGRLVDAVYAANCGGHGESNHYVWTTEPNPILRGVWDSATPPSLDLSEEKQVTQFLTTPPDAWCKDASVEGGNNYRWQKTLSASDWNTIMNNLGIGRIRTITDIARGVSGRMYRLTFVGERGSKTVMKELNIRKLFGGLKSACFIADWTRDAAGFITGGALTGGGFGHGVGMCQTGAQSMAKRGHAFDRILSHYFPGSVLKRIY